jgi:hypothetical protein
MSSTTTITPTPVAPTPIPSTGSNVLSSMWSSATTISPRLGIGLIILIGAITTLSISNTSANVDAATKTYLDGGGAFGLVIGLAIMLISKDTFDKIRNFTPTSGESGALLIVVVVAITIAIFTLLFYNFAPAETLPFASTVLITLTVIGIIGVLYTYAGRQQLASSITRFVLALYFFMPYALFTFGFIIDMMNRKLQYIPASFSGLTGILFNYALGVVINKRQPPPVSNALCEIPGLSVLSSELAPQPMMFTLTTLAHIATYISRSSITDGSLKFAVDANYRWPAWVLFFGVFGLHAVVLLKNECVDKTTIFQKIGWGLLLPLAYGGITGAIQSATLGRREGFGNIGEMTAIKLPDVPVDKKATEKSTAAPEVATCAKGAKDGEFICESFTDGKLVSKVMTE